MQFHFIEVEVCAFQEYAEVAIQIQSQSRYLGIMAEYFQSKVGKTR